MAHATFSALALPAHLWYPSSRLTWVVRNVYYLLEHFAVAISAVTGVLAARKQVDLFGVIALALVTALGGGTIRDVILAHGPVFWVEDSRFLDTAVITAVIMFCLVRINELPRMILLIADAFSLALFTIVGTEKAASFHVPPSVAIAMGIVTGVAGGILRDLLMGQIPLVFQREIYLYATAAFCGASLFVLLKHYAVDSHTNMILSTVVALLIRFAGIRWRLALPMFRTKSKEQRSDTPPFSH
jgi:uncharacterized membrane protein YeiH